MSFTDKNNKYPNQVIDLRLQVDHIHPKKNQLFGEDRGASIFAILFMILIRHGKIKMISDEDENTEVDFF